MPLFDVYVTFGDKKLVFKEIEADNEFRAEMKIREKLRVHKIVPSEVVKAKENNNSIPDIFNIFGDIFGK